MSLRGLRSTIIGKRSAAVSARFNSVVAPTTTASSACMAGLLPSSMMMAMKTTNTTSSAMLQQCQMRSFLSCTTRRLDDDDLAAPSTSERVNGIIIRARSSSVKTRFAFVEDENKVKYFFPFSTLKKEFEAAEIYHGLRVSFIPEELDAATQAANSGNKKPQLAKALEVEILEGQDSERITGELLKTPRGKNASRYCFVQCPPKEGEEGEGKRMFFPFANKNFENEYQEVYDGLQVSCTALPSPSGGDKADVATNVKVDWAAMEPFKQFGKLRLVAQPEKKFEFAFVSGDDDVSYFLHKDSYYGHWPWNDGQKVSFFVSSSTKGNLDARGLTTHNKAPIAHDVNDEASSGAADDDE